MPGTVIKQYREMRNYSQKYVASRLGISQNALSKIENNITQLTVRHVKELSKILEVPVTDLLKDEFEIHKPTYIPKVVTKLELLDQIEKLHKHVTSKHTKRHESFIVAMSLVAAADAAVTVAH